MRMMLHEITFYDGKYILNQLQEMDQEIKFRTNHKLNPARMPQNGNSWLVISLATTEDNKVQNHGSPDTQNLQMQLGGTKIVSKIELNRNATFSQNIGLVTS